MRIKNADGERQGNGSEEEMKGAISTTSLRNWRSKTRRNIRVYLGVKTCDIFSLFYELVLGFGYCLMVSWLFCFLCFTSSVSLTSFYTEDEPNIKI